MPRPQGPPCRLVLAIVFASFFLSFLFISRFRNLSQGTRHPDYLIQKSASGLTVHPELLSGHVIAPKLGNETAKAELGRAAWKLFHTTFARFPDEPTEDESLALLTYVHLFQRLYPCGECATHFREILDRFPPQVSSRSTAAAWGCHVHNEVNKSLGKEIFDCSKIGDFYDCGCADDEKAGAQSTGDASNDALEKVGHDPREPASDEREPVELKHEGWTKGG